MASNILKKLAEISRQLEIPVVKKLKPELKLKPRKKNFDGEKQNEGRNNRGNRGNRNNRNNRNNKGGNRNAKNNQENRRERNQNRKSNRPRLEAPSEIVSNEKKSDDKASKPIEKSVETKPEIKNEAVKTSTPVQAKAENTPKAEKPVEKSENKGGRPPLKPRGTAKNDSAESKSQEISDAPKNEAPAAKAIRHGRRNQVKKVPSFEENEA